MKIFRLPSTVYRPPFKTIGLKSLLKFPQMKSVE